MKFFLLRYDRRHRRLLELTPFDDADAALRARFDREADVLPDVEVVVLGAEDEAALHRTHARYFGAEGLGALVDAK